MLLLIDNYDSFTWNLVHALGRQGSEVAVHRNDTLTVAEALALKPSGIVISPGPCAPDQAGISLDLIRAAHDHGLPLLGVCLGHQAIGQAFGGRVIRAPVPVHGKVWPVHHQGQGLFAGLSQPFTATRYHSLVVERETLPNCLTVTAETEDGLIMGLAHAERPLVGVQFHPESIATEEGEKILSNFLKLTA